MLCNTQKKKYLFLLVGEGLAPPAIPDGEKEALVGTGVPDCPLSPTDKKCTANFIISIVGQGPPHPSCYATHLPLKGKAFYAKNGRR